jgi:hypothetical protein
VIVAIVIQTRGAPAAQPDESLAPPTPH